MSEYFERCRLAAEQALNDSGIDERIQGIPWELIIRAILEAGRLSECPAAVEAAAACSFQTIEGEPWNEYPEALERATYDQYRSELKASLRAAEDAVLGKEK